jgi:uncharacterized damage-inducible protein DinB
MRLKSNITDCVALLEQGITLIAQIDDNIYSALTPISPRGSVGGHLRHILNFYQSFLRGFAEGRIDYNQRERDARFELDRLYASNSIQNTIECLETLCHLEPHDHLLVKTEDDSGWSRSSVLRELDVLQSHTIHHYSLIAMLLRLHEIEPGDDFGVAPSTLRHWQQEAVCAR